MRQGTSFRHALLAVAACLILSGTMTPAFAKPINRTFCIYDPIGANGFIYHEMQDYVTAALRWGVHLHPKPYTNESVAVADFKAGKCDAVGMTGVRDIHFVKFAGSLDMVGGLRTYKEEKTAIEVISSPKAAPLMQQGGYEVAGVIPGGKVFLFARRKSFLDSLKKAAGKKIAVLGFDKQASTVANVAGATPVPASIASFGPMFNNHNVDYAYAPSYAYKALELYKGLGKKGGIADFTLGMLSLQMVIHKNRFPKSYGQKSRDWVVNHLMPKAFRMVKRFDHQIPSHYWVHISGQRSKKYRKLLVQIRQKLWKEHWYSHRMQHLLKKIRCHYNPSLAECSEKYEGGPV